MEENIKRSLTITTIHGKSYAFADVVGDNGIHSDNDVFEVRYVSGKSRRKETFTINRRLIATTDGFEYKEKTTEDKALKAYCIKCGSLEVAWDGRNIIWICDRCGHSMSTYEILLDIKNRKAINVEKA